MDKHNQRIIISIGTLALSGNGSIDSSPSLMIASSATPGKNDKIGQSVYAPG